MKNVLLAEVTSKLKKYIYMAHKTATEIVTLGGIDSFYVLVFFSSCILRLSLYVTVGDYSLEKVLQRYM